MRTQAKENTHKQIKQAWCVRACVSLSCCRCRLVDALLHLHVRIVTLARSTALRQDAIALKAVSGQVGTLVMDLEGQVLSCTGQLEGDIGEQAAEAVFSILQVRVRSLSYLQSMDVCACGCTSRSIGVTP